MSLNEEKDKEKINEKQKTIKNYHDADKDENIDLDKDEDYEEHLIREIEIEMESLWNADLGEQDNNQDKMEDEQPRMISGQEKDQTETAHLEEQMEERGSGSKHPHGNNVGIKKIQVGDPDPKNKAIQQEKSDMPTPNTDNMIEEMLTNPDPNPDLDFSKYKWRFIHGSWNYITNSAWEGILDGAEHLRNEPATVRRVSLALRWSLIAGRLPGRTANDIKNHWNTHLSKRSIPKEKPWNTKTIFKGSAKEKPKETREEFRIIKPRPRTINPVTWSWLKEYGGPSHGLQFQEKIGMPDRPLSSSKKNNTSMDGNAIIPYNNLDDNAFLGIDDMPIREVETNFGVGSVGGNGDEEFFLNGDEGWDAFLLDIDL
ncbi:hypothetical protein J5N97_011418 [Dioscorea zingiberensis]|uniref:Uncharacterized protein n=1 Tax=Dioscorea zingiberensis TaxID=325984 RepID=A0A9D5HNL1_9LILI|nr:hypothetical protein J5N97_011418 [Dioscorea zingiberensis]